jgi:hypothetical protein
VLILADTRHVVGEEADSIAELVAFLALAQTPVARLATSPTPSSIW